MKMKKNIYILIVFSTILIQCCINGKLENVENKKSSKVTLNTIKKEKPLAQKIIDKTIYFHGGDNYSNSEVNFDFRDKHYSVRREEGIFNFTRSFKNKNGEKIYDQLNNEGFQRKVNGKPVSLTKKWIRKYANSVNSVAYFAMLPFGLNDPAVQKEYLGEVDVKNKTYYKIKVSFSQKNGGEDFEDVFVYWINKQSSTMDYLAYLYHTNGGGKRFRKAFNTQKINGIIFQNFVNYKEIDQTTSIVNYDKLYEEGKLKALSRIENKNIKVKLLK